MSASAEPGLLLGLDIGTTAIKATVIDAAGVEVAAAAGPTPFAPSPDGVEMEVGALGVALRRVIGALGPARGGVVAVGLAGMAESGAPFGDGHRQGVAGAGAPTAPALVATGPIIAWHDGRGESTVASLELRFGSALARRTGRRLRTVSSLAKLGWLVERGLPVPARWLGVPEIVLFLLTGAESTEFSLAARTGAYHVAEQRFLPEVVAHVLGAGAGAAEGLFPPVRPAGSAMGFLSEEAAATHGLPGGIPVTIAGHDHLAAAAGLGARPDDLLNSVGTAETLIRRLERPPDVEAALGLDLAVTVWPGGKAWGVLVGAVRSGLVVDALAAHLGRDPAALDRAVTAAGPHRPPAGPDRPAPGGAENLVTLGQGIAVPSGSPAEMWGATLRALARRTAAAAGRVAALTGPYQRVVVFGGGSRSAVWTEIKAQELGVPVVRCQVADATARGAALAAGAAAGWWASAAKGPTPALDGDDRRAQP